MRDGEPPVIATALSRFEEASRTWADDDGAVLSLERLVGPEKDDASLLVELQDEMVRCWPEMDGAPVLESRLQRWTVPLLTPGFSTRMPAQAAVPGLHLAGEHLLVEPGVLGAEAAIRSGRLAAESALQPLP